MSEAIINLNTVCTFQLTAEGERILADYYRAYGSAPLRPDPILKEGFYRFELWRIMEIFGPSIYLGSRPILKDNRIRIPFAGSTV